MKDEVRKVLLEMYQKAIVDFDNPKDRFTGIITLPNNALDTALAKIDAIYKKGSPLKQEPPKIEQLNIPMSVDWDNIKLLEDKINELVRRVNELDR